MSLRRIIKEEIDDFQWIKDILPSHPENFEHRIREFINKYASHWEDVEINVEPIDEVYGDLQEIGRIWMDEYDDGEVVGSWYWDMLIDNVESEFVVELYEKHADSYEALEHHRFKSFDDAMRWTFETMAE
jgi:hypothetical protein